MRKVFVAVLFLFATSLDVLAEKITAEMVELQTLENSPSIKEAKYDLYMAEQAFYSSLSSLLPSVSLFGNLATRNGGFSKTIYGIAVGKLGDQSYNYGLNWQVPVISGFSDYNKLRSLSAKVKAAREAYKRAVSDAVVDAQNAYVILMHTYESINLFKKIKQRKIENVDLIKLRHHSGNADLGSLRRVEADVKVAEYELASAQRAIETASAALLVAIGRDDGLTILETDEKIGIGTDIDGDSVDDEIISRPDFDSIITKIPEFLAAKYTLASAKALSWSQKGQWLPSINLNGSIDRQRYDKTWNPENKSWSATLNLSYPLFTGGKRWFDMKSLSAQEKKAAEHFRNTQNILKAKAVQYYNDWVNRYEFLTVIKYSLQSCKLQTDIARRKYINGLVSYEDWYSIEESYTNAQKSVLSSRRNEVTSKIAWRKFLGKASMIDKEDNK
jgi:outer membrane protein TolC